MAMADTNQEQPVTLRAIADQMGLSKGTISRALRDDPRVRQETIARVRAVATALGYDPTRYASARAMALRRHGKAAVHGVIGAVMPSHFQRVRYYREIHQGIIEMVQERGFSLLTAFVDPPDAVNSPGFTPISQIVAQREVDGLLVVWSRTDFQEHLAQLRDSRRFGDRPVVSLLYSLPNCHSVLPDDHHGGYEAAMHLLDQGHRHLVQLVIQSYHTGDENMHRRIAGVEFALQQHGLPSGHLRRLEVPIWWLTPYTLDEYETPTRMAEVIPSPYGANIVAFFRAHPEITAVLSPNDSCAARIWYLLEHLGYRLPQEMSIVGYDDTDSCAGENKLCDITSVRVPLQVMGRSAADLLISEVLGDSVASTSRVLLPTHLVVRGSTMPPPARPHTHPR